MVLNVVIVADWRDPQEIPPRPLLEALAAARTTGARVAASREARYAETPPAVPDGTGPLGEALAWALGRLDRPLPVGQLARRANMSRRHFDRRFREVIGTTPASWLTHQRVLRARQLLDETPLPVEVVARRCGFSGGAALRPHFRRIVGTVPAAYRASGAAAHAPAGY